MRRKLQTVNSQHYVEMIHNFLTPQIAGFPVNIQTLFQQDGDTSHTARISMNAVNVLFPGHVISRNGNIPWPTRLPDLTACDFFLGTLKNKSISSRFTQNHSSPQATNCGRDCGNSCQHAARGHKKLPGQAPRMP